MTSAPSPAVAPHLERWLDQLRAIRRDDAALTGGLAEAQLAWRPGPGRWSIAEVVKHLNLSARPYLDAIAHALAGARARGLSDGGGWRPTLVGGLFARSMEPPPRIRLPAPRIFRPAEGAPPPPGARELATWRSLHLEMEERIREAAGVDLRRARFVSPVTRWVRMNAGDAFAVLLAHERRHLWQMGQIKESEGFPRG
ncbi:DinB superfamily protein [bacterium JGI 053]|nr:DinB superfamily protein [bacterium JGI 053]